ARYVQAPSGGRREALVDIERVERVEPVIDISCIGTDRSIAEPSDRMDDRAITRNGGIYRYGEVGIDETERAVSIEIADAAIDAAADQEIVIVIEQPCGAGRLQ